MQLGDDDDAVGIPGGHIVARIHLPQADPPVDGRGDVRVGEIQFRGLSPAALSEATVPIILAEGGALRIDLSAATPSPA